MQGTYSTLLAETCLPPKAIPRAAPNGTMGTIECTRGRSKEHIRKTRPTRQSDVKRGIAPERIFTGTELYVIGERLLI